MKCNVSNEEIKKIEAESKLRYPYDLVKWGGDCVVMNVRKTITV